VKDKYIVVLGAGVCGLTAARELARAGKRVLVLEKESEVGGLCRTITVNGCRVDLGSHRFHTDAYEGNARAVLESLDPKMLKSRPRRGLIRFNRSYVPYPPHVYDLLRTFTLRQLAACGRGWFRQRFRPEPVPGEPNFESHIVGKIGREAYELFYRDAAQKHWLLPPRELSVDEVKKRVETTEPMKVLGDALRAMVGLRKPKKMTFLYPPGGIGEIPRALASDLERGGGRVILTSRPIAIHCDMAGRVSGIEYKEGGDVSKIPAEAVFSTIPLTELADLLPGEKPQSMTEALKQFSWRALRLLYCRVPEITWTEAETFYFPEMKFPFGRISRPRLFDVQMGGKGPGELICVELACSKDDEIYAAGEGGLISRLLSPLREAELLPPDRQPYPEKLFTERLDCAYAVLHLGWRRSFRLVYDWLTEKSNIYPLGRQGLYLHNNIDQTMDLGYRCAHHYLDHGPGHRQSWDRDIEQWSNLKIKY